MQRRRRKYPVLCHPTRKATARGLCGACYTYLQKQLQSGTSTPRSIELLAIVEGHEARKVQVAVEWERVVKIQKERNPDRYRKGRDKALRDRYGITLLEFERLMTAQEGRCAICAVEPEDGKPLYVDHHHETGVIRGLLCPRCNNFVAVFDKDDNTIKRLMRYVDKIGLRWPKLVD